MVVNGKVVRCVLNPFKPARIPYYAVPYEHNPYSFFGVGIAENMDDTQTLMNGFMRMAVDNAVLSGNLLIEVDETTTPPTFIVDRYVNLTNSEMDWFLVRRYIDNPANIILEVDKPAGGTSPGILKPQYLSRDAEDNIDTILENLRRDTLI